jgi:hypothetical protein
MGAHSERQIPPVRAYIAEASFNSALNPMARCNNVRVQIPNKLLPTHGWPAAKDHRLVGFGGDDAIDSTWNFL